MKTIARIPIVLILLLAAEGLTAPLITRVDPPDVVASKAKGTKVILIRGYRIWKGSTGHDEYVKRTKVYIRRDGAFQHIPTNRHGYWQGTDKQELAINVPTQPWLAKAGTFEVMVKVDGKESNYYQVSVLEGPPKIEKVTPSSITLTGKGIFGGKHSIRIAASNLGNALKTSVLLDGKRLDSYRLRPGSLIAFISETTFKKPGKYGLQVKSSAGLSKKKSITLASPALILHQQQETVKLKKPEKVKLMPLSSTITYEGEKLKTTVKPGKPKPATQSMTRFGKSWSNNAQLYWNPKGKESLWLHFSVPREGNYQVVAYFTKARDYGKFKVYVNEKRAGKTFDGYHANVIHAGKFHLGTVRLKKDGGNVIRLKITGKNSKSTGYMLGLDRIELTPSAAAKKELKPMETKVMPLP